MQVYLEETELLDYSSSNIQKLVADQGWKSLSDTNKTRSIYGFIRQLPEQTEMPGKSRASCILQQGSAGGYGLGTLCMALLRAVGIPCRIHGGLVIEKETHNGFWKLGSLGFRVLSIYVEVYIEDTWYALGPFENYHQSQSQKAESYSLKEELPSLEEEAPAFADMGIYISPDAFMDNLEETRSFWPSSFKKHFRKRT